MTRRASRPPALPPLRCLRIPALLLALAFALPTARAAIPDSLRVTTHSWLYGIGRANVLDTYLSPLEYTGPSLAAFHISERPARWGKGKVSFTGLFSGQGSRLHSPTEDGDAWDARLSAAFGWHHNWHPLRGLRLAAGGLAEASGGVTYNTRNGNNPAQGIAAADLRLSAIAEWAFRLSGRSLTACLRADAPLIGAMFSPSYGQSYYEMFSLGHGDRNVRLTHPFNAPSVRMAATLTVPVAGARLTLGYAADVRQSHVNGLKRHLWNNQFVLGYVRTIRILR